MNDYQTVLEGVRCHKMRRSWRNRSNVVRWQWVGYAYKLLGQEANMHDCYRFGACLYVACGWYAARSGSEIFDAAIVPSPQGWNVIQAMVEDFLIRPPDQALTRGAWEEQQQKNAVAARNLKVSHITQL